MRSQLMYAYTKNLSDDKVDSLVCFCCARRFPHVEDLQRNPIDWHQPLKNKDLFMGLTATQAERILGFENYKKKYGRCEGANMPNLLNAPEEFQDWLVRVQIGTANFEMLCCPEDVECEKKTCLERRTLCEACRVPICSDCNGYFNSVEPSLPPAALANDMMIFYAPTEIYSLNVTVVEMICASVCITSMICCTLEMRNRKENPFDSTVHMSRHRMGARGNATSFPLPWNNLMTELMRLDGQNTPEQAVELPWTGVELADKVRCLLPGQIFGFIGT